MRSTLQGARFQSGSFCLILNLPTRGGVSACHHGCSDQCVRVNCFLVCQWCVSVGVGGEGDLLSQCGLKGLNKSSGLNEWGGF